MSKNMQRTGIFDLLRMSMTSHLL